MSPARVLQYPNVIRRLNASRGPVSILLGSGFSIALDARYGYPALLASAFPARSRIQKLFATSSTTDFERVMAGLHGAAAYAQFYGRPGATTASALRRDVFKIAVEFRRALAVTHHGSVTDVTDTHYDAARTFLDGFANVFTLNYDLLLYWALNRQELAGNPPRQDGFLPDEGRHLWSPGNRQRVYWLHGGLHLFPDLVTVEKLTYASVQGPLLSEICRRVASGTYPLIVLEGTAQQKEHAITASPYLRHALGALRTLRGSLVVFGVGAADSDKHIRKAIVDSSVSHVAVSIYPGAHSTDHVLSTWSGLSALRHRSTPLNVSFFSSATAQVW